MVNNKYPDGQGEAFTFLMGSPHTDSGGYRIYETFTPVIKYISIATMLY